MRRLQPHTQTRFYDLMYRNNEGRLTVSEREELIDLVARYKVMLLLNTEALLKVNGPQPYLAKRS